MDDLCILYHSLFPGATFNHTESQFEDSQDNLITNYHKHKCRLNTLIDQFGTLYKPSPYLYFLLSRGCAYPVLQTVQSPVQCVCGAVHYKDT